MADQPKHGTHNRGRRRRAVVAGIGIVAGGLVAVVGVGVTESQAAADAASPPSAQRVSATAPAVPHTEVWPRAASLDFSASPAPATEEGPLVIEKILPPTPEDPMVDLVDGLSTEAEPGALSPHAQMVADLLRQRFGLTSIGGYRPLSSVHDDPTNGHSTGKALDLMVAMTPDGSAKGDAIAHFLQAHALELKVKYVIWNQQIWSASKGDGGWRPMPDRGSDTQNHKDHVHVSFA